MAECFNIVIKTVMQYMSFYEDLFMQVLRNICMKHPTAKILGYMILAVIN